MSDFFDPPRNASLRRLFRRWFRSGLSNLLEPLTDRMLELEEALEEYDDEHAAEAMEEEDEIHNALEELEDHLEIELAEGDLFEDDDFLPAEPVFQRFFLPDHPSSTSVLIGPDDEIIEIETTLEDNGSFRLVAVCAEFDASSSNVILESLHVRGTTKNLLVHPGLVLTCYSVGDGAALLHPAILSSSTVVARLRGGDREERISLGLRILPGPIYE